MLLIGRARGIWHHIAALAGALAILAQVVLFAWHHHASSFHPQGHFSCHHQGDANVPGIGAPSYDHGCQICFNLSHHGAVPVDFSRQSRLSRRRGIGRGYKRSWPTSGALLPLPIPRPPSRLSLPSPTDLRQHLLGTPNIKRNPDPQPGLRGLGA